MSSTSDGPDTGPMAEPVAQTGRPPVPRPVPSDAGARSTPDDGVHRTEAVPFPLPPLPAGGQPDPATGRLYLGGYPPRVPGAVPGPPPPEPPRTAASGDAGGNGDDDGR